MIQHYRVRITAMLFYLFIVCTALMPFFSLFWQEKLFFIKINWLLYPVLICGVFFSIIWRLKLPVSCFMLLIFFGFYLTIAWVHNGEFETIVRFFIALLPFTFYRVFFLERKVFKTKFFWWIYGASFAVPLYYAYLQYTGQMPYYDFDVINNQQIGRVSGGYSKPMNFIAFLLPVYLLAFYLWMVQRKKLIGLTLIGSILVLIYVIGHRTSLFAFVMIFISSFFMRNIISGITFYYRYLLNFFVGIGSLIFFRLLLSYAGVIDIIRGRVPMWEAHSRQFFDSGLLKILFGSQKVWLLENYRYPGIQIFEEVHNNTFRTILIFGIVGFFFYCVFMRAIVMILSKFNGDIQLKFIMFSGFTYFIFYSITNEPVYYGSILWPTLIWIFLALSELPYHSSQDTKNEA